MNYEKKKMIQEEQNRLDKLIDSMDQFILEKRKDITNAELQEKKIKDKCLADTYGDFLYAVEQAETAREKIKRISEAKKDLYRYRLILEAYELGKKTDEDDIYVGLHTYTDKGRAFVYSWNEKVCREFILNPNKMECDINGSLKGINRTWHYVLKLKRDISIDFNEVKDVTQLYPYIDETTPVSDLFLRELLKRRSEKEFQNIVFSIQKLQGDIIQEPFSQSLIVQGCAGSGKSMIMLHRLPILLFDNQKTLDRKKLFIVTPSASYIHMVENLLVDLEIEDLPMGTISDYYNILIEKYGRGISSYGRKSKSEVIDSNFETYIYSEQCVKDITSEIQARIDDGKLDYLEKDFIFLDNEKRNMTGSVSSIVKTIILNMTDLVTNNDSVLRVYYESLRAMVRKVGVVTSKIRSYKYNNDEPVLLELFDMADRMEKSIQTIKIIDNDWSVVKGSYLYYCIDKSEEVINELRKLIESTEGFLERNEMFPEKNEIDIRSLKDRIDEYQTITTEYLSAEEWAKLEWGISYYSQLDDQIVDSIYITLMRVAGRVSKKSSIEAAGYSPYLYLLILYLYFGVPNAANERFVTIDEAQNLSRMELLLIRRVNNNEVVLNLFGDINQHIENEKGINNWKEIPYSNEFQIFELNQNYRNARQITEFCNSQFSMNMKAINIDGKGYRICNNWDSLEWEINHSLLEEKPEGLCSIIVKDEEDANSIVSLFNNSNSIKDLTKEDDSVDDDKWNLLTIDQAKGLEFGAVYVLSNKMTKNEKYIAYTRALDELCVYEGEIPIISKDDETKEENEEPLPLLDFLANKGLEVIDERKTMGLLWIMGDEIVLKETVGEVESVYGVSGEYYNGPVTGNRLGWFTKIDN